MPKRKTKSKHLQGAKAKAVNGKGKNKSNHARGAKAKAKAKTEDGKGMADEVDCRFCDFTSESEKILRRHIRSQHAADAR